ncbi:helix-turn-helix domain-containing protein [Geobacter sp. AOG2]|uniref:helix-turn-helix domain-containing protein n=1 Tax=Geobacter sp. AOG2 TaxID=1566347 RepID=UPI001CC65149|nr:helix-turn-helix domain-containing protein [Geobacter sp. AOG2]GFE60591.1 hypothetical protein AOG2_11790 [Geobacter sp. AOG2]
MTTAELLAAVARECPNGVSFDPMAMRLLRQKVPFEDWQIENLKAEMFQLRNGLWFSREMVSGDEPLLAFHGQAMEWLKEYSCFSVEQLFKNFCGVFRHIVTPEDCAAFLRHLGFAVAVWKKGGYFCFKPPSSLDDSLLAISEAIAGWIEEADGTLTFHEIEQAMPHLSAEALESIRVHFLPEVHETEVGGMPCWCSTEGIPLPEDFSEILTTAVDTLVELNEKVSAAKLEFALNLFYRIHLREEYALKDNDTFMRVCAKHYQGRYDVFPKGRRLRLERADKQDEYQTVKMSPHTKVHELENGIIGLEGRPLSPSTWRLFKSVGSSPRVAEWVRRVENGESVEKIANENGLTVSTVRQYIKNHDRYFLICEKNSIVPKGTANV